MTYELLIADIKNVKILKKERERLSNELVGIEHALYGIKGGSFVDVMIKGESIRQFFHGGYVSEEQKIERAEMLTLRKEAIKKDIESIDHRLLKVTRCLTALPEETKNIINEIYCRGGWDSAVRKFNRSSSSLSRQMRRDIERLL